MVRDLSWTTVIKSLSFGFVVQGLGNDLNLRGYGMKLDHCDHVTNQRLGLGILSSGTGELFEFERTGTEIGLLSSCHQPRTTVSLDIRNFEFRDWKMI